MTNVGRRAGSWLRAGMGRLVPIGLVLTFAAACAVAPAVPGRDAAPAGSISAATAATDTGPVGPTETARVVRVVDGDTIIVDRGHGNERLRYIGIDTPESVRPGTPIESMAVEASAANEGLVAGREIVLERDVSELDQYRRLLRYVWLGDGTGWLFVNRELVRRGFAHAVTYPPDVRWLDVLRRAEREARIAGVGLWAAAPPHHDHAPGRAARPGDQAFAAAFARPFALAGTIRALPARGRISLS